MNPSRGLTARALATALAVTSCVTPTDRSQQLRVEVDSIPSLLLKDSIALEARVFDESGAAVTNAVVAFASSDQTVISIDTLGMLRAVGTGTATVTATAVGFAEATAFTQDARVRGLLEIDSIVPAQARFGELMEIYGVGLDTNDLFSITLSGFNQQNVDAPVSSFEPFDPERPQGEARLTVWVPPPAERRSRLTVLGFNGGLVFPDTLQVQQRDLYEPNDTVPAALGPIPFGFRNPALAFEPEQRNEGVALDIDPADWYTFENQTAQDRTLVFFSDNVGAQSFGIFVTDSLGWGGIAQQYVIGRDSWAIGPQSYFCSRLEFSQNGETVELSEVLFPLSIIAIKDMPAGTYHILAPYVASGTPASYELLILSTYFSLLAPDQAEENDYCDVATPLATTGSANLTIDNPHDIDWFRFTLNAPTTLSFSVTATGGADGFTEEEPDVDLYLVQDFRPDSLVLIDAAVTGGDTDAISAALLPGDYFLVVFDFAGIPTRYTLTSAVGALPPAQTGATLSVRERIANKGRARDTAPVRLEWPR